MSCPFHDNDAAERSLQQPSSQQSGLARLWRGLRCPYCRQSQAAGRRIARGMAQMQAAALPEAGLSRLLDALGLPALPGLTEAERAGLRANLRRLLLLIGMVLFVTTLMQPEVIGRKAVESVLLGGWDTNALQSSRLWLLLGLAWYVRPLLALWVQGVSGSHSRGSVNVRRWLIGSACAAACLWLVLGGNSARGVSLALLIGVGGLLALASTVVGGQLVEQGQRMGATGRLGALHGGAIFLARLAGAGVTGVWGTTSLPQTAPFCAALLVVFALLCGWLLRARKPQAKRDARLRPAPSITLSAAPSTGLQMVEEGSSKRENAAASLRALFGSKNVWGAACIAMLIYIAPNFTSLQYQENLRLGFGLRVQDGLDFTGGACGLLGVGGYLFLCRRLPLQTLLNVGIVCNTLGTLLYLGYRSVLTAFLIEGANGLLSALVFAMLFDLAIRAIPRGQAMLGYAFLTSVIALASHLSNVFGSWLNAHMGWQFAHVVSLSAALGLPALAVVALLPATLLDRREGKIVEEAFISQRAGAGVPSHSLL